MSDIENTNAASPVAVTQADREAAAALFGTSPWSIDQFISGKRDKTDKVQAFARHRIAERERCAQMLDQKAASLEALGRATNSKQCLSEAGEFRGFAYYVRRGGQ